MRFDIMTLFPALVEGVLSESIIGRAQKSGAITVAAHNIRDYSTDKHRRVDDTPYGGGRGMLMAAPPVYDCYCGVCSIADAALGGGTDIRRRVIYLSPKGRVLTQDYAQTLTEYDNLILLCGHYEGIDQRVLDEIVDEEISVGDYVLTGGELPACILVDCIARMLPGVLPEAVCYESESIACGLLEYPQYTRPAVFHGVPVPEVLLSGHHENIDRWRLDEARRLTARLRPELLSSDDRDALSGITQKQKKKKEKSPCETKS